MNYSITYAQNREDLIVAGFLKNVKNGFYVDVGANDPDLYSVTKRLYMSGWHGINIEPSARLFKKLELKRTRDINLMVGVGSGNKEEVFREYLHGDGLSTFSDVMKQSYEETGYAPTVEFTDTVVRIRTLKSIFDELSVDCIDFLKIDIEGYEYEAIVGNDWKKYRPTLLCIEANHIDNDWRPILIRQGYFLAFFDGLNEYYITKESKNLADNFSYPEAVLGQTYVSLQEHELIRSYKDEIRKLDQEKYTLSHQLWMASSNIENLEKHISDSNQRLGELEFHVWQSRRLKQSFKVFIRALDGTIRANIIRLQNSFLTQRAAEVNSVDEVKLPLSNSKNKLLSLIRIYDYELNLSKSRQNQEDQNMRRYTINLELVYVGITRGVARTFKHFKAVIRKVNI